jgi:hypothetical protein
MVTVTGQGAIAFDSEGLYCNKNVVFSSLNSEDIVVISYAEDSEGYEQAFQEIISTFEFINWQPDLSNEANRHFQGEA